MAVQQRRQQRRLEHAGAEIPGRSEAGQAQVGSAKEQLGARQDTFPSVPVARGLLARIWVVPYARLLGKAPRRSPPPTLMIRSFVNISRDPCSR